MAKYYGLSRTSKQLLYLCWRYLTGDASQSPSNKEYLIEKIEQRLGIKTKEK